MKRQTMLTVLAAILVFAMMLTACGSEKAPETTAATTAAPTTAETAAPQPLTLTDWSMHASTWSSPNGATIHITATPNYYEEGHKADFVVRLESDDISSVPCQWDGSSYTASADLNAENGYCYYMVLTAADGTTSEIAVNTPAEPINEAFINMAASLESYCSVTVEESAFEGSQLTLSNCKVQVQAPLITNEGETIGCQDAVLLLSFNGEELDQTNVELEETDTAGLWEATISDLTFEIPEMEDDQKVELTLNATLTNGQALSAYGGNWFYNQEGLLPVVG